MGREANASKPRTCAKCQAVIVSTAKEIKTHAKKCGGPA